MPQRKGSKPRGSKKGGGGGKFTWGKAGEVLEFEPLKKTDPAYDPYLDDPDYVEPPRAAEAASAPAPAVPEDRETSIARSMGISVAPHQPELVSEDSRVATPSAGSAAPAAGGAGAARMTLGMYKAAVKPIIREFFDGADLAELYRSLSELDAPLLRYEFVKRAATMAMDRTDREKEMVSRALSELYDVLLTMSHVAKGFERLLEQADDLKLDVPDAHETIAKFLARAVNDEILPPAWLTDPNIVATHGPIVEHAKTLLSIKQASARLERVWGVSDANASLDELKQEVSLLVEEFFITGDVQETVAALKQLGVPHFLHEAVKRAVLLAIDRTPAERAAVVKLLQAAKADAVVPQTVMEEGFSIVAQRLPDVVLDTPAARGIYAELKDACISASILPEGFGEEDSAPAETTAAAAAE